MRLIFHKTRETKGYAVYQSSKPLAGEQFNQTLYFPKDLPDTLIFDQVEQEAIVHA